VAISVAGVYHLGDKRPLFRELLRIIRPGGRFVLSDVAADTPVARFFDGFVGDHNSTGHKGIFLDGRTLEELTEAGWKMLSHRLARFHWAFADSAAMVAFCRGLFAICKADDAAIARALADGPGVDRLPDGRTGLRCSLMTIVAQRPDACAARAGRLASVRSGAGLRRLCPWQRLSLAAVRAGRAGPARISLPRCCRAHRGAAPLLRVATSAGEGWRRGTEPCLATRHARRLPGRRRLAGGRGGAARSGGGPASHASRCAGQGAGGGHRGAALLSGQSPISASSR
jgi:hypothetical protein